MKKLIDKLREERTLTSEEFAHLLSHYDDEALACVFLLSYRKKRETKRRGEPPLAKNPPRRNRFAFYRLIPVLY